MIVSKKVSFDAAHYLPHYDGKCARVHGHHWEVEVACSGPLNASSGMVVDFAWLKKVLNTEVVEKFDHCCLNDYFQNPTAEEIARYLYDRVRDEWNMRVEYVRVWESEDSMVEYNGGSDGTLLP